MRPTAPPSKLDGFHQELFPGSPIHANPIDVDPVRARGSELVRPSHKSNDEKHVFCPRLRRLGFGYGSHPHLAVALSVDAVGTPNRWAPTMIDLLQQDRGASLRICPTFAAATPEESARQFTWFIDTDYN
jgi:hypothetical protein